MCNGICDATPRNLWLGTNPGTAFICIMQTRFSTRSFVLAQTCLLAICCKFSSHPPFNMARASCSAPVPHPRKLPSCAPSIVSCRNWLGFYTLTHLPPARVSSHRRGARRIPIALSAMRCVGGITHIIMLFHFNLLINV